VEGTRNKGITARDLLIRFNRDTGTVRPLLRRTSINSRREVVGMDNKRMDSLSRVRITVSLLPPSLSSSTARHRLGVTDNLLGAMDNLRFRTVRLRVRRLTGKVQDNLPLPAVEDNLRLPLMDKLNLNLLPLTERL
jgi:hypothetical protein